MECQGLVSFLLNLVIFATFIRFRRALLTSADYKLFCSMTFADMLVGFHAVLYGELLRTGQQQIIYKTSAILPMFTSMFASITSLICITVNRLIAVKKPLRYRAIVTSEKLLAAFVLIWTVPGVVYAIQLSIYLKSSSKAELQIRSYLTAVFFITSSLLLIVSNALMYCAVKRQIKLIAAQTCISHHLKVVSRVAAGKSVTSVKDRYESSVDNNNEGYFAEENDERKTTKEARNDWNKQNSVTILGENNSKLGLATIDGIRRAKAQNGEQSIENSSMRKKILKFSDIYESDRTMVSSIVDVEEFRSNEEHEDDPNLTKNDQLSFSKWTCSVEKTFSNDSNRNEQLACPTNKEIVPPIERCILMDNSLAASPSVEQRDQTHTRNENEVGEYKDTDKNTGKSGRCAEVMREHVKENRRRHNKIGMARNLAMAFNRVRIRRRNNPQTGRQTLDMTHMCILVVLAFIFCWLPLTVYRCRYLLGMEPIVWLRRFALFLATGNSIVNPCIYLLKQKHLRKYVKRLLWQKKRLLVSDRTN
eukprot:gene4223-20412_t